MVPRGPDVQNSSLSEPERRIGALWPPEVNAVLWTGYKADESALCCRHGSASRTWPRLMTAPCLRCSGFAYRRRDFLRDFDARTGRGDAVLAGRSGRAGGMPACRSGALRAKPLARASQLSE